MQEHVAVDDPGFCIIKHSPLDTCRMAAQQTVNMYFSKARLKKGPLR